MMITDQGYVAMYSPLATTVMMAYVPVLLPPKGNMAGAPGWVNDVPYDIVAKIGPDDLAAWRALKNNSIDKPELQRMLQEMLKERCNLRAHLVTGLVAGLALSPTKRSGTLLPASAADVLPPNATPFLGGGKLVFPQGRGKGLVRFYDSPIASLVDFLSIQGNVPILDKTSLKGKYNFTLSIRQISTEEAQEAVWQQSENKWDVEALGLKLVAAKIPQQQVVVDHIDRPTSN